MLPCPFNDIIPPIYTAPLFTYNAYGLVNVPPPVIVGAPAIYSVYAFVAAPDARVVDGAVKYEK